MNITKNEFAIKIVILMKEKVFDKQNQNKM